MRQFDALNLIEFPSRQNFTEIGSNLYFLQISRKPLKKFYTAFFSTCMVYSKTIRSRKKRFLNFLQKIS